MMRYVMKHAKKKEHKVLKLFNTPLKRIGIFALATVIGVGSVVTVMAATNKATILDNGVPYRVNLTTTDTDELLEKANITLGADDIVERDDTNGVVIQVRRAMETTVKADGAETAVNANYGDKVADVIAKAGVSLDDNDVVNTDKDSKLTEDTDIVVTRYHRITLVENGTSQTLEVPEGTVANALQTAGIALGKEDVLSIAENEPVADGMEITVQRVAYATQTVTETVPFETQVVETEELYQGETKIQTAGVNGTKTVVKECKFVNGQLAESTDVAVISETAPVAEVQLVGTKAKPAAAKPAASSANTSAPKKETISGNTIVDASGKVLNVARVLTGQCTAYTGGGITATGAPAAVGRVAVNPNVIPYGTKLYIASPDGSIVYGYAIASDTGGALMSGQVLVDLYYDTLGECINFGRRPMNVYILA